MRVTYRQLRQIIREALEKPLPTGAWEFTEEEREDLRSIGDWVLPAEYENIQIDMKDSEIPKVKKKIISALELLSKKARPEFEIVRNNLKKITSGEKSGIDIRNKKFSVSDVSILDQTTEWLASIIYHDAYHVEQGEKGWHKKDRETPANLKQLDLLRKLGADNEIAHLAAVIKAGDHSDLDGDGDFDMDDYNLRTY